MPVRALNDGAQRTAGLVNEFVAKAAQLMSEEDRANMLLLRGFAQMPSLPPMGEVYRMNPAAIAAYPMYRGLATVAGMKVISTGRHFSDEVETMRQNFGNHDFFFIHYKPADAAGEDGDFDAKVQRLEELDPLIPAIRELEPDVFMVAGDHATPAITAGHSWHPVPFMLQLAADPGRRHPGLQRAGLPSRFHRQHPGHQRDAVGDVPRREDGEVRAVEWAAELPRPASAFLHTAGDAPTLTLPRRERELL